MVSTQYIYEQVVRNLSENPIATPKAIHGETLRLVWDGLVQIVTNLALLVRLSDLT